MANDLVVQLGAKLDQFQSDMNAAGDVADAAISRIESSFANLNPGISLAGIGAGFAGAIAGAGALLTALQGVNSELASIAKNAAYVGVSTDRFQQIQFGATQGGVTSEAATADLKKVTDLLSDAKANENSLTKILDANNVKYKDRNGQVVNLNELLTIAGNLLGRFDSIPDKTKAAQMLGLSEGWVGALKGGPKAFDDIANSASAAGAVIDSQTIAKAANFDEAWKKSSDLLSRQFKAAAADVAGFLDDLISKAQDFIDQLNKANGIQGGSGQDKFNAIADSMDIARKEAGGLSQDVDQLTRVINRMSVTGGDPDIIRGLEAARVEAQKTSDQITATQKLAAKFQFPDGNVPLPGARPAAADDKTGDGKLPVRKAADNSRDQFEIAVDSVTKHTATIKADTAAVFENNAAQASFRAEFTELTAIMRDGGEVTQAQIDSYEKLRASMSATQALEASGITLTKAHRDAFLSSSQAIGTATTAFDKAKDSLSKINSASSQIGSALSSAFADAVVEGKSLNDVLLSLVQTLEKAAINSVFASIFNAPASGGLSPFASALGLGKIGKNAQGTDNWSGGPTWVGENGPEIVNLPKGAQVIPNAVARSGTSGAQIYNNFMVAGDVSQRTIDALQSAVVTAHKKVDKLSKVFTSTQRQQSTGVG